MNTNTKSLDFPTFLNPLSISSVNVLYDIAHFFKFIESLTLVKQQRRYQHLETSEVFGE